MMTSASLATTLFIIFTFVNAMTSHSTGLNLILNLKRWWARKAEAVPKKPRVSLITRPLDRTDDRAAEMRRTSVQSNLKMWKLTLTHSSDSVQPTSPSPDPNWSTRRVVFWQLALTRTPDPIRPTRRCPDPNRPQGMQLFLKTCNNWFLLPVRASKQASLFAQ